MSLNLHPQSLNGQFESSASHAQLRPESTTSRSVWEGDVFDHGPDIPTVSSGVDDNIPVAISKDALSGVTSPPEDDDEDQEQESGFTCKKMLRGFWGTRQTEDTQTDRELYIRTTIRELVMYIFFLITLCILTFGMTSSTHYYYTKVMQELFIDSEFEDTGNTFRGITTMQDFWRFSEGPLMNGLFWEQYYNSQNLTKDDLGYIYYENKLLGLARIRQLKVRNGSCEVHPDFQEEITSCYDSYSQAQEDTEPFGPETETAWKYHTEEELDGSSHWGLLDYTYSGGGYYQDLSTTKAKSLALIGELKSNLWLERGTRVTFIDFTVYNANINLFCVVRLVIEFPATGGAVPSWQFRTVKLLRYVTTYDYFLLGCEILYLAFIFYYIIEEILEIKKMRFSYFLGVWNCLDILVILLSLVALAFNVYRTLTVNSLLEGLLEKPNTYPDFEFLGFWQVQYNNMVAVVVFFAWIKIFKYISFNRTMTQLQSTLSRCSKDIAGFAIMFFIIFFAYAQLGYLVFGTQVKDFSTFPESIFTQFRIILGDFDFHALESANRVLGPIFFLTYVFFVFFVLLNMFLAIINDTYSEVKAEIANQKSEFEFSDFIKKSYNKVLEKLSLKKDRIKDIQEAIQRADLNQDKDVDWEEWRVDLKMRGIPDAEIEAVFAKYDQDGDMILNDDEQRRLRADLEKQKANLNVELNEIEQHKVEPVQRPPTAKSHFSYGTTNESDDDYDPYNRPRTNMKNYVSKEELQGVIRRIDRMEQSVGAVVSKIDSVIVKLEAMERAKTKRRETMEKFLDGSSTELDRGDFSKHLQQGSLAKKMKDELASWGSALSLRSNRPSRPQTAKRDHDAEAPFSPKSPDRIGSSGSIDDRSLFTPRSIPQQSTNIPMNLPAVDSVPSNSFLRGSRSRISPTPSPSNPGSRSQSRISRTTPDLRAVNNLNIPSGGSDQDSS